MQTIQHHLNSWIRIALVVALSLTAVGAFAGDDPVVNINSAEKAELSLLPRVGPALAQRIIDYREENGSFEQTSDLLLVRGIGEKTFALMEPFVTVKGDTTLSRKLRVSDLEARDKAEDDDSNSHRR